jgi:hypothetical protein
MPKEFSQEEETHFTSDKLYQNKTMSTLSTKKRQPYLERVLEVLFVDEHAKIQMTCLSYPPSKFSNIGCDSFNINAHYLDP